jgi:hypothetical protein
MDIDDSLVLDIQEDMEEGSKNIIRVLIQPTISLEMSVPSQGHYGFHSFPVVD